MKKQRLLTKYFLTLFLTAIASLAFAQQVTVNLNIIPPYSPYYRDYTSGTSNKVLVTLLYSNAVSGDPIQIFLSGSIRKDDNSILLALKEGYRPGMPITLVPNVPQTLTGAQLRNMFGNGTTNDLIVNGITTQEIITNQALPEGGYQFCAKAMDYSKGTPLGESCRSMFIAHGEPPQIVTPLNNGFEIAKTPQFVMIRWTPVTPFIQGLTYRLRVVKLPEGVSAIDAITYSTQVVLEKSNIQATEFPLDLSSGIQLDTGAVYVVQVTGVTQYAYIKNFGKSEPVLFRYRGDPLAQKISPLSGEFGFLNPAYRGKNKPDTLKVNSENDLLINWCWKKKLTDNTTIVDDSAAIKSMNIQQYVLKIDRKNVAAKNAATQQNFAFTSVFVKKPGTDSISNYLMLKEADALQAGFADGDTYSASMQVYGLNNQLLLTALSPEFVYKTTANETASVGVPVQAVVNYSFQNFPDIYPVKNTGITLEAFKLQPGNSGQAGTAGDNLLKSLPTEIIGGRNFARIASTVVTTDTLGKVQTEIKVPSLYFDHDSILYRLKISNQYYIDKNFRTITLPVSKKDSTLNFGQLMAKTYAYQLKLKVTKQFTTYRLVKNENGLTVELAKGDPLFQSSSNSTNDKTQSYSYSIEQSTKAEGIPVVLYRENKPATVPPFEGEITKNSGTISNKQTGITVVSLGMTQTEKDSTYVVFDKLLATNFQGEEYKILAIKNLDELLAPVSQGKTGTPNLFTKQYVSQINTGGMTQEISQSLANVIQNLSGNGPTTTFIDSAGFVAEKMVFKLPLPAGNEGPEAYYRHVKANYNIISCKPPTSVFRGKLFYTWSSDANGIRRPLANTHFRVMVDYVDGKNKSIGAVTNTMPGGLVPGHWEYTSFQPANSDEVIPLVDQYATMAEGTTDGDGNFTIEVVNFNKKGDLGAGSVINSEGHTKPPITGQSLEDKLKNFGQESVNPWDQSGQFGDQFGQLGNQQNVGHQGSLNNNFNVGFNAGSFSFEVGGINNKGGLQNGGNAGMNMNFAPVYPFGPAPFDASAMDDSKQTSTVYSQFKRIYRIVIDGESAPYYYPSKEVVEIQPFQNQTTPYNITHFVREFRLIVKTCELKTSKDTIPLSEMQVTLFRDESTKPKNLPQGEGDGKYTHKELINPEYSNKSGIDNQTDLNPANIYSQKFEQLWPTSPTDNQSTVKLGALLQAQYQDYFVQSSSYVNTGTKTYKSTIVEVPKINDTNVDWTSPVIPDVNLKIVLEPLISRALVHVKDSASGKNLTTGNATRILISNNKLNFIGNYVLGTYKSKDVDKYGYAELLASDQPLNSYVGPSNTNNPVNIYFYAKANGYNYSTQPYMVPFVYKGKQATPVLALIPSARITGTVSTPDVNTRSIQKLPVEAYLQVDSGKVYETDKMGKFDIPIAPVAGSKLKIIPKDVAYFDTLYVLVAADQNKQLIDLKNIDVFRRKHRLEFNVFRKMPAGYNAGKTRVKDAKIQLGESVKTTDEFGKARFIFENVSVNNYTFIIKGPNGQGYIPKTLNLKSTESKEYKMVNVELEKGSEVTGVVKLDGQPVKHARVYLEVANTGTQTNYQNYEYAGPNQSSQSNGPSLNPNTQYNVNNQKPPANGNVYQVNQTALGINASTGSITADANLVEAYTDALGKYKLQGIPVNNQKVNLLATLDTTFTVSGDQQQVNIQNGTGTSNLELKSFGQAMVNKLYGFPLTVEKLTPVNENQIKVTGLVHWTEAISDFGLEEVNKVLRVEDVLFDLVTKNNATTAVAHDGSVKISSVTNLKLSYIDKYNVKLTALSATPGQGFNTNPLSITKVDDYGKISGRMQIVDNSFNYPSSYLSFTGSEFYLAKLRTDSTINNNVSVATSALTETESNNSAYSKPQAYREQVNSRINNYRQAAKPVYYLCDKNGDSIRFKLINFVAKAYPGRSYIDQTGKIHLNTLLSCKIPNAQPENFSIRIPDMVLDDNKVYPASGSQPIILSLEKWTLEAKNWNFSTTEGGILSSDALIRTKLIDIPVGKFVLRSDMFLIDDFKMDKLTLAGGKFPLANIATDRAHLNYEYKVGTDMKPHWNFSLLGTGNTRVASLPALQGMRTLDNQDYPIDLNYIEILSNNEMIVQLMQKPDKARIMGNSLAQFEPLTIFNGPNYINVSGLLNTGAPRMSDIDLTTRWTSPTSNPEFETVSTDFEGKGFVHFVASKDNISITDNLITIDGQVMEKPDKTFNPIPAKFFARSSGTNKGSNGGVLQTSLNNQLSGSSNFEVVLQKDWVTQLSEDEPDGAKVPTTSQQGYSLKITDGSMKVVNNDWTTLKYEGLMMSNAKSADNIADSKTKFEVLGDISANSDGLAVTGINTPFGSMSQTFDFKKKELIGSLTINMEVLLGTVRLHSGTIETCFGAPGFYVAGGCYAFIPAGILAGDYNLGFMAGHHELTDQLWNTTNSYIDPSVINVCYKQSTTNLSGFYFAFNREIINKSVDFDYVIASGYVKALALIGGDFYINATSDWKVGGDGYVHVGVNAGLSAITGTSINGGVNGDGKILFQVGNPSYFDANLKLGFNASLEQSLGVTTLKKTVSVGCYASGGTSGFDFNLGSGINVLSCPPAN